LRSKLSSLGYFLSQTNLFISVAAVCSLFTVYITFDMDVDLHLGSFIFFSTLFTYNVQRILGKIGNTSAQVRTNQLFVTIGFLGMSIFIWRLNPFQFFLLAFCGFLSIAYAYPVIPLGKARIPLRMLPRAKLWVIVMVWVLSTVVMPIYFTNLPRLVMFLYVLHHFFFIAALTIPFDIRDLKSDSPRQKTIPQNIGVKNSIRLSIIFLIGSILTSFGLYLFGDIRLGVLVANAFNLLISVLIVSKAKIGNHHYYFTFLVDGMIILQYILIVLVKYYF